MAALIEEELLERMKHLNAVTPFLLAYLAISLWTNCATPIPLHEGSVRHIPTQPLLSKAGVKLDIPIKSPFSEKTTNNPCLAIVSSSILIT
jgi:hypothetical protein